MRKILFLISALLLVQSITFADYDVINYMNKKDLTVLTQGEKINYPLKDGDLIECYAKKIDGSIDEFKEYNDYFLMQNGHFYSNTMHKIYKPEKGLKKVDGVRLINGGRTLRLYDPLWEGSIRHHVKTVKIELETGRYYMKGTQDNWMWYRNVVTDGYCRVITPATALN